MTDPDRDPTKRRGKPSRLRLDQLVVDLGLAPSRSQARSLIMMGRVLVDGVKVCKAGVSVPSTSSLRVLDDGRRYVSRGGLKLARAIESFQVEVEGLVALDVGASTGGFTDCLLEAGATRVYAVDVGYGQLHWRLRNDPRVVVMERTNIRHLHRLPEDAEIAVIDVSFISLSLVLPAVKGLLADAGEIVALVKPQFEAGRDKVARGGVVRDPVVRRGAIERVLEVARELGFEVLGGVDSPIRGPKGNLEHLVYLRLS